MTVANASLASTSDLINGTLAVTVFNQLTIPANVTVTTDTVIIDITTASYKGLLLLGLGATNLSNYNNVVLPVTANFISPRTTYARAIFDSVVGMRFFAAKLEQPLTFGQFATYFDLQWAYNASLLSLSSGAAIQLVLPPGYRLPGTSSYQSPSFTVTTGVTVAILNFTSSQAVLTIG